MTTSQALLTDSSSAPVASDRRAHPRISGDLLLVQQARLKFGPSVAIVDLSAGGALLETAIPLRPGGASALELLAGERAAIVPFRVTRSYVVGLQGPVLYRGACAFDRPLAMPGFLRSAALDVVQETSVTEPDCAEGWSEIIVSLLDGKLVRGYTRAFHPARPNLEIWPSITAPAVERTSVPLSQVKTVVFVRDVRENGVFAVRDASAAADSDLAVEVTFADNQMIRGAALGYDPDGPGFFLSSTNPHARNTRTFVVSSAVADLRVL